MLYISLHMNFTTHLQTKSYEQKTGCIDKISVLVFKALQARLSYEFLSSL